MTLSDLIISGHSCLLVVGLVRYKGKENDFQVLASFWLVLAFFWRLVCLCFLRTAYCFVKALLFLIHKHNLGILRLVINCY